MPDPGTVSSLVSARPIIKIDDKENPILSQGLLSMLVEENTQGMCRCELVFGNWGTKGNAVDFLYFDRQILDFGKKVSIEAGEGDTQSRIFYGRLTALEAHYPTERPPDLLIMAEDSLQLMRMVRRTRSFEKVSDSDVIKEVAKDYSLKTSLDIDGPTYHVVTQVNQSDLAFLRERARAIDAELWIDDKTIHVQARSRRKTADITLTYPTGLKEFSVTADLANQCTSLVVGGWDVSGKESIVYTADDSVIKSELDNRESGSSILKKTFEERVDRIVHLSPHNKEEAEYTGKSHYRMKARRFITGRGYSDGDGRLKVGVSLKLEGLGDLFDGKYYVAEVRHVFDLKNGYRTYFKVERPGLK